MVGLTEIVALAGSRHPEQATIKLAWNRNRRLDIVLVLSIPHFVNWRTTETYETLRKQIVLLGPAYCSSG
jgi:hypothetical protein